MGDIVMGVLLAVSMLSLLTVVTVALSGYRPQEELTADERRSFYDNAERLAEVDDR